MTYKLFFDIEAQKEWNKLDKTIQQAFKKYNTIMQKQSL